METRKVISFYELEEEWQKEALSNLGECAEEAQYLEPKEDQTPEKHILWDLTECMPFMGNHEGFKYNAVIGISNNSAMLVMFDDNMESATIKII